MRGSWIDRAAVCVCVLISSIAAGQSQREGPETDGSTTATVKSRKKIKNRAACLFSPLAFFVLHGSGLCLGSDASHSGLGQLTMGTIRHRQANLIQIILSLRLSRVVGCVELRV